MVNSQGLTHAAAIAYWSLLSLFPFLLLILSLLGSLTADQADRDAAVDFVFRYFPRQFDFITRQLDAFRGQSVRIGIGGGVTLTWASLGVFNALSSAVNHAWGVEHHRSFLKHRLFSFIMLLSASGVFASALVVASAAKVAQSTWFWTLLGGSPWIAWLTGLSAAFATTLLLIVCVALVFYFVPNTKVRFRYVWPGAIVTGVLWHGAFAAFAWYASDLARWNVIHGSIATVVVFLLWIYISAVILLYGVEMSASYSRIKDVAKPDPRSGPSSAPGV